MMAHQQRLYSWWNREPASPRFLRMVESSEQEPAYCCLRMMVR